MNRVDLSSVTIKSRYGKTVHAKESAKESDETKLPKDGTRVEAMTYGNEDEGIEPKRVEGEIHTRQVKSLGYTQCWVGGVQVRPETVKALDSA